MLTPIIKPSKAAIIIYPYDVCYKLGILHDPIVKGLPRELVNLTYLYFAGFSATLHKELDYAYPCN